MEHTATPKVKRYMPKHERTAHGFAVEVQGNAVWISFITAKDLLKHAGTRLAFTNELQRALEIGFEVERRKRLGLLRTVFALDSKTTDKEIEEVALRHDVDISFVKDTPEARGRKKHSEARVDVELLEEVEAYKSLHRFRSVIPTRGLADSLGRPKSSRVRIDGGEGEIRHATGAYTSRGL